MAKRAKRRAPAMCLATHKVMYRSELDAKIGMANCQRSSHDVLPRRVYRCEFCKQWHLTSQDKRLDAGRG